MKDSVPAGSHVRSGLCGSAKGHDHWPEAGDDLWRGCCNAWECDEMGHQNVRFYLMRAMEGTTELLARMGLATRPLPGQDSSTRVVEHHLRMMREVRAGTPLHLRGGFVGISEHRASVAQLLYHSECGEVAASFSAELAYLGPDGSALPWPEELRSASSMLDKPEPCNPRGLLEDWRPPRDHAAAAACGMTLTGRGIVADDACDQHGIIRTEGVIALFADSTRLLTNSFHRAAAVPGAPANIGSAGVEARLRYHRHPRAGERFVVRGGIADLTARSRRVLYCLFEAATGDLLAELQTLELLLNLDTRRSFGITRDALHSLSHLVLSLEATD